MDKLIERLSLDHYGIVRIREEAESFHSECLFSLYTEWEFAIAQYEVAKLKFDVLNELADDVEDDVFQERCIQYLADVTEHKEKYLLAWKVYEAALHTAREVRRSRRSLEGGET